MLPMEIVVPSLRVSKQNGLNPQEYSEAMMMELELLDGKRLQVLNHIIIQEKKKVLGHTTNGSEERFLKKGSSLEGGATHRF